MYIDPTPLSLGSYKSNDAFDIYARTEYQFESKDTQQEIALRMRLENTPQEKFSHRIIFFSVSCDSYNLNCYSIRI